MLRFLTIFKILKTQKMISGYGLENLILEQANLSKYIPLVPYYDHGWSLNDKIRQSIIDNPSREHLAWNTRVVKIHSKLKNKKFYVTGSPYTFFVNKYSIKKKFNKNTVFFFSHSTSKISQEININFLIDELNKLPENLKPVDICLHYFDIKNYAKIFEKNGFEIRCAGKINSNDYPNKFYDILTDYSFSCSNNLGSYVLYSLYVNIPFFLIGPEPMYDNYGLDKNVPRKYKLSQFQAAQKILPLFKNFLPKISREQNLMMESELGIKDKINDQNLREIILKSFKNSIKNPLKSKPLVRSLVRTLFMKYKSIF